MAESQPLIIEQIAGERRRVTLSGATLPDQGVETAVEQQLNRQFLPGAKQAVVQVLGLDLPEINLSGSFNDALIGEAGAALSLVDTLQAMVVEGQPIDVYWGDYGTFARRGYLRSFRPVWRLVDLVDWTLTIAPDSLTETFNADAFTFAPADQAEAAGRTGATADELHSAQSGAGLVTALGAL